MAPSSLATGASWPTAKTDSSIDAYFSADVETDGPVPGAFSMLSFALVYAGSFDGHVFTRPHRFDDTFYVELKPISDRFEPEALAVNGLNRDRLQRVGADPHHAMTGAAEWVRRVAAGRRPILVAYPLSFDWTWMYWYFVNFSASGSAFNHSGCFDLKTAYAIKADVPIAQAGRDQMRSDLLPAKPHTHNALDDAIHQAEIFANLFEWKRHDGR